jgi:hypothetical protein
VLLPWSKKQRLRAKLMVQSVKTDSMLMVFVRSLRDEYRDEVVVYDEALAAVRLPGQEGAGTALLTAEEAK